MEQSPKHHLTNALEHAQEYLEIQKELIKLQAAKHGGTVLGNIAAVLLISIFFLVFYILGNIAVVFCINSELNNLTLSFTIVSASNLALVLLLIVLRKSVIKPIQNLIIKLITE